MLRVTAVSADDKIVILKLKGKLVGRWMPDFERICLYHKNDKGDTVLLDLAGATFIEKM